MHTDANGCSHMGLNVSEVARVLRMSAATTLNPRPWRSALDAGGDGDYVAARAGVIARHTWRDKTFRSRTELASVSKVEEFIEALARAGHSADPRVEDHAHPPSASLCGAA